MMACLALWNITSGESFRSNVLSEIDFMYSTKESENKESECIFFKGKFFEDDLGEIWIECFQCFLWAYLDCNSEENAEYICDSYK